MRLVCVATALSAALIASAANAENCSMVGCSGRVGYVFVPLPDQQAGGTVKFNGSSYDVRRPLFGEPGLPKVNAEPKLGRSAQLFTEAAVREHIAKFKQITVSTDSDGQKEVGGDEPKVGDAMEAGTHVRVLSYTTFSPPSPNRQNFVFVLVQILNN